MKLLILFSLFFHINLVYGQEIKFNDYSLESFRDVELSNPGLFKLYKAYSEKGFEISKYNNRCKNAKVINAIPMRKKGETISIATFLKANTSNNINPLNYRFLPSQMEQVYHLGDSNQYLIIPAQNNYLVK